MMNENQPGQTQVWSPQPSQSNTPLTSGLRTSTGASSNVPRAGPQQTTGEYLRQYAGSKNSNNAPSSCKDKTQVRCRQPNLKNLFRQAGSNTSTGASSNVPRARSKQVRQKVANNNRPCKEVRQQPKGSKTSSLNLPGNPQVSSLLLQDPVSTKCTKSVKPMARFILRSSTRAWPGENGSRRIWLRYLKNRLLSISRSSPCRENEESGRLNKIPFSPPLVWSPVRLYKAKSFRALSSRSVDKTQRNVM